MLPSDWESLGLHKTASHNYQFDSYDLSKTHNQIGFYNEKCNNKIQTKNGEEACGDCKALSVPCEFNPGKIVADYKKVYLPDIWNCWATFIYVKFPCAVSIIDKNGNEVDLGCGHYHQTPNKTDTKTHDTRIRLVKYKISVNYDGLVLKSFKSVKDNVSIIENNAVKMTEARRTHRSKAIWAWDNGFEYDPNIPGPANYKCVEAVGYNEGSCYNWLDMDGDIPVLQKNLQGHIDDIHDYYDSILVYNCKSSTSGSTWFNDFIGWSTFVETYLNVDDTASNVDWYWGSFDDAEYVVGNAGKKYYQPPDLFKYGTDSDAFVEAVRALTGTEKTTVKDIKK